MVRLAEIGPGFSAPRAAAIAGITYRQIDYWDRIGLVVPSIRSQRGSGTRRRYSADDVRLLALLAQVSQDQRRTVAEAMRSRGNVCHRIVVDVVGGAVYCIDSDDDIIPAVRACAPNVSTLIDVDRILPELADAEPPM